MMRRRRRRWMMMNDDDTYLHAHSQREKEKNFKKETPLDAKVSRNMRLCCWC